LEQGAAALDQVLAKASQGGVVIIPHLLPTFEKVLGKSLNLSTLYRMLARHGWRKIAPDTAHPQGDPQRRDAFKKTPRADLAQTLTTFTRPRPVRLMFQDKARFGRISDCCYCCYCWAKFPLRPTVKAM
jgi:Winged helix-turn helix